MLVILIRNDGTGTDAAANYEYTVMINKEPIVRGKYSGHNRAEGWAVLVRDIANRHIEAMEHMPELPYTGGDV